MTHPDFDIGPQLPQPDPRGWLVFEYLPTALQGLEDSRQYADIEKSRSGHWGQWSRPATATERALLAHLGYDVPDRLMTRITMVTNNFRNRSWPALADQVPTTEGE